MKTLLLMRHAKSDWDADYGADHDRPLNDRGVRSARIMGEVLIREGVHPDLVISSTATRARTTAELAADAGNWDCDIRLERSLYERGPDGVLEVARTAADVGRLMLVGHQPTWGILASELGGRGVAMKTATVAVFDIPINDWADLSADRASLNRVFQPRDYLDDDSG